MALSHPTLALVFAFVLVGYAIWDLDQLSGRRYATRTRVSLAGAGAVGAVSLPVLAGAQPPSADRPDTVPGGTEPIAERGPLAAGEPAVLQAVDEHAAPRTRDEHAAASRGVACADGSYPGSGGFLRSPAVTVGCRITMGIVMAFMLLIAL